MKVTTDACLFGAWVAGEVGSLQLAVGSSRLLDIGTGTGLLSLMVAQKNVVLIEAIEIDATTVGQANENVAASPWKERINIVHANVLQRQTPTQYDCIFSNPPFYKNELKSSKENKNVAHHDEGLKLTELFSFIENHLKEDGSFFLLLPTKREKEIEQLLEENNLFLQQRILVQQTPKHLPFRMMIRGRRKRVEGVRENTIAIKNETDEYTQEFISLLKEYYLYL